MDKKDAQLIVQNIDKILGKSVKKEEAEETQLDEALPIPGAVTPTLGAFVRGHRIINQYMLLAMTVFPKETAAHKLVAALQKPLGAFVNAMDEFWSEHKVLFGLLFGTMLAMDLFGTSAVVAKEKFLIILRKQIAKTYGLEDAGEAAALPDPNVIDAEFTEKPAPTPSKTDTSGMFSSLRKEEVNRMKDLAGIKKVL
jgi:hypothetical protein